MKQEIEIERLKKGYIVKRSWCKQGIRYFKRLEFEIINQLNQKYPIKMLCEVMNVNRSGYYKWKKRKDIPNRYEQTRNLLTKSLREQHMKHKAAGYHRLAYYVRKETGWIFSDNLAHKCCKFAKIRSQAKHYKYRKPGDEHLEFNNIIKGNWNATKPLEIVCSDMTCLFSKGKRYEWTYILDTYNNEIIASSLSEKEGDAKPYFDCLEQLKQKIKRESRTHHFAYRSRFRLLFKSIFLCSSKL